MQRSIFISLVIAAAGCSNQATDSGSVPTGQNSSVPTVGPQKSEAATSGEVTGDKTASVEPAKSKQRKPAEGRPQASGEPSAALSRTGDLAIVGFYVIGRSDPRDPRVKRLVLWDVKTGAMRWSVGGLNTLWPVGFSADGKQVLIHDEHAAKLWDVEKGQPVRTVLQDSGMSIHGLVLSADGRIALAGCSDAEVGFFLLVSNMQTGAKTRHVLGRNRRFFQALALTGDGRFAFVSSFARSQDDKVLQLWDLGNNKILKTFDPLWGGPFALSSDSKCAVCTQRLPVVNPLLPPPPSDAVVLRLPDLEEIRRLPIAGRYAFGSDWRKLVINDENLNLHLVDIPSARQLWTKVQLGWLRAASADGKRLLTAEGNAICVRDLSSGEVVRNFPLGNNGLPE